MISEIIKKYKFVITFLGDIIIFFLSIILVLYFRYGNENFLAQLSVHIEPFAVVLILWLIIFYISNLYTCNAFNNTLGTTQNFISVLLISFFITITIFYIFSRFFNLTPKVNLIIFTIIFGFLDLLWRHILRQIFINKKHHLSIIMLSTSPLVKIVTEHIDANPQLGYSLHVFDYDSTKLAEIINKYFVNIIITDRQFHKNHEITKILYSLLPNNIEVIMFTDFYESLFKNIPITEVEDEWLMKEITKNNNNYEQVKYLLEIILAFLGVIITLPLTIIIIILIVATSPGPVIFKQERIGKNNKPFVLYKFRTMKIDQTGPLWTTLKDNRLTYVGKFLRYTHLDEIPQLFNVLKGDISFVGPRPERTELVKIYEKIPYYNVRHIIKPGITGWAQLNYKASTSIEEAQEKFQFDLYYLKNRSSVLDLFILLKTIRMIFIKN